MAARERFAGNINYGLKLYAQRYNIKRRDRKKAIELYYVTKNILLKIFICNVTFESIINEKPIT